MSLPPELSAQVFKELGPEEVQAITMEISKLPQISPEVRAKVIEEFLQNTGGGGGLLPEAAPSPFRDPIPGPGPAPPLPSAGARQRPLDFLRRVDPRQILHLIRKEHPQTIALVLYYLQPQQASTILGDLPPQVQTEVARRMPELRKVAPEILSEVEKVLEQRLHQALEEGTFQHQDGKETLLEILNQADRNTEEKILTGLTQKSPHLASDIKTKLCDFEDLNNIDDASLQQVLRLTDFRDLVLALKGANRDLSERIYRFLSPEVARALRDDVESLGQVPWEEIKAAQQQIRNILRGLVTLGKIKFK
jgi:flagellar motor switch protein FliG